MEPDWLFSQGAGSDLSLTFSPRACQSDRTWNSPTAAHFLFPVGSKRGKVCSNSPENSVGPRREAGRYEVVLLPIYTPAPRKVWHSQQQFTCIHINHQLINSNGSVHAVEEASLDYSLAPGYQAAASQLHGESLKMKTGFRRNSGEHEWARSAERHISHYPRWNRGHALLPETFTRQRDCPEQRANTGIFSINKNTIWLSGSLNRQNIEASGRPFRGSESSRGKTPVT